MQTFRARTRPATTAATSGASWRCRHGKIREPTMPPPQRQRRHLMPPGDALIVGDGRFAEAGFDCWRSRGLLRMTRFSSGRAAEYARVSASARRRRMPGALADGSAIYAPPSRCARLAHSGVTSSYRRSFDYAVGDAADEISAAISRRPVSRFGDDRRVLATAGRVCPGAAVVLPDSISLLGDGARALGSARASRQAQIRALGAVSRISAGRAMRRQRRKRPRMPPGPAAATRGALLPRGDALGAASSRARRGRR